MPFFCNEISLFNLQWNAIPPLILKGFNKLVKLITLDWDPYPKIVPVDFCLKFMQSKHKSLGLILDTPIINIMKIHNSFDYVG